MKQTTCVGTKPIDDILHASGKEKAMYVVNIFNKKTMKKATQEDDEALAEVVSSTYNDATEREEYLRWISLYSAIYKYYPFYLACYNAYVGAIHKLEALLGQVEMLDRESQRLNEMRQTAEKEGDEEFATSLDYYYCQTYKDGEMYPLKKKGRYFLPYKDLDNIKQAINILEDVSIELHSCVEAIFRFAKANRCKRFIPTSLMDAIKKLDTPAKSLISEYTSERIKKDADASPNRKQIGKMHIKDYTDLTYQEDKVMSYVQKLEENLTILNRDYE